MKKNRLSKLLVVLVSAICGYQVSGALAEKSQQQPNYPKALSDISDHAQLAKEVGDYRKDRLLSLDQFLAKAKEDNVIILDSRSKLRFDKMHLQGAKNLVFSDYTSDTLAQVIPDKNTTVLIYCNNNFKGDQVNFASKIVLPNDDDDETADFLAQKKPLMLALNIPVFINLYGYGYKNVYEVGELVNVQDPRINFEGEDVKKVSFNSSSF